MPLLASALTWTVGSRHRTASKPSTGTHRPSRCRDDDCPRLLCRGYKDGHEDGYEDGYSAGYQAGYAAGAASRSK